MQRVLLTVAISLALFSACAPSSSELRDGEGEEIRDHEEMKIETFAIYTPMMMFGSASGLLGSLDSYMGRGRVGAIRMLIAMAVSHQALDFMAIAFTDLRAHQVVINLVSEDGERLFSLRRSELVRHFEEFEEFYLNQEVDELVGPDGDIHDQFLGDLIALEKGDGLSAKEKREFVRQMVTVLRYDEWTDREWLVENGITEKAAIEFHRLKNRLWEDRQEQMENLQKNLNATYITLGSFAVVGGSALTTSEKRSAQIFGIVLAVAASGWITQQLLSKKDPVIDAKLQGHPEMARLRSGPISSVLSACRLRFANMTVDDVIDPETGEVDPYAAILIAQLTEGRELSPVETRTVMQQLLLVLQAEDDDTLEDLRQRGVKGTQYLEIFKAWKGLR